MGMSEYGMTSQPNDSINAIGQSPERDRSQKTPIFRQLRTLRWPDLPTLLGLLCVSSSVYYSYKGVFAVAYILILVQFFFDYVDGKLARTIGGGALGVYLD